MNDQDESAPQLPLWLQALERLRPDQINVLTALVLLKDLSSRPLALLEVADRQTKLPYRRGNGLLSRD